MQVETEVTTSQIQLIIKHRWLEDYYRKGNLTLEQYKQKAYELSSVVII